MDVPVFLLVVLAILFLTIAVIMVATWVLPAREHIPPTASRSLRAWGLFLRWNIPTAVIVFCGLLIPIVIVVGTSARPALHAALSAKTSNMISQIDTAVLNYVMEYAEVPPAKDQAGLIKNLMGDSSRGIAFLSLKPRDMNAQGEVLDAWGTPIQIRVIDTQTIDIRSAGQDKTWQTPDEMNDDTSPETAD